MNNEPAFPITEDNYYEATNSYVRENRYPGLSKREWFAGMALQGILSTIPHNADWSASGMAETCLRVADAMLEQSKLTK